MARRGGHLIGSNRGGVALPGTVNGRRIRIPFTPPPIPSGYYDPALDAQSRAAQRGYGDLQNSLALAGTRSAADLGIALGNIGTARTRETQDYQTRTAGLARSFGILANQQRDRAAASGILSPGLALLSAQKRAANQALQQSALNTAHMRAGQDFTNQAGAVNLAYQRNVADRATQGAIAGRENVQFGLDTEAEKAYQAQQAGYVAPTRPTSMPIRPPAAPRPSRPRGRGRGRLVGRTGGQVARR